MYACEFSFCFNDSLLILIVIREQGRIKSCRLIDLKYAKFFPILARQCILGLFYKNTQFAHTSILIAGLIGSFFIKLFLHEIFGVIQRVDLLPIKSLT